MCALLFACTGFTTETKETFERRYNLSHFKPVFVYFEFDMLFSDAKHAYDAILKKYLLPYIFEGIAEYDDHVPDLVDSLRDKCTTCLSTSSVHFEISEPQFNPQDHELYEVYNTEGESLLPIYIDIIKSVAESTRESIFENSSFPKLITSKRKICLPWSSNTIREVYEVC